MKKTILLVVLVTIMLLVFGGCTKITNTIYHPDKANIPALVQDEMRKQAKDSSSSVYVCYRTQSVVYYGSIEDGDVIVRDAIVTQVDDSANETVLFVIFIVIIFLVLSFWIILAIN